jgi:hypothetical protein
MKHPLARLTVIFGLFSAIITHANTLYVDLNSANPTPPYSDWTTAATNIQDAIDASGDGDQIWVTNGVYQTGGKAMAGNLTNRVALNKAVTVQSVNGPFVTTIAGIGATNGLIAVRCAWLTNNAALVGFTLMGGAARNTGDLVLQESGGGIWCASSNAFVSGCLIVSNTAYARGGGAYQGTLKNCFISRNSVQQSPFGAAVYSAILNNCTAISNGCAGFAACMATNSICYYNLANNYSGGSFSYCCVTPLAPGTGNFASAPVFFLDRIHLALGSPGIGAGTTPVTSTDIFGNAWASPPSVGCAETAGAPYLSSPQLQLTGSPVGFTIKASALGGLPLTYAWLKDGAALQDNAHLTGTQSTNLIANGVNFTDAGNYQFVASNSSGSVTGAVTQVVIHCVDGTGSNPVAPYTTWETAATNIQDAIDAAGSGEIVLVTNGIYSTGGKIVSGDLTNRVVLDKPVITTSVNGYASTIIEGLWDSATNGPGAVRCAWLTNGAVLNGFTLRKGATRSTDAPATDLQYGGGAWMTSNGIVSNCLLTNNSAAVYGGGVAFGNANNCFLTYNTAQLSGGGAYGAQLNNCTLRENHCFTPFGGAGVYSCKSCNCIIADNYSSQFGVTDYQLMNYQSGFGTFTNCCVSPLPFPNHGSIDVAPRFLDFYAGFALAPTSPCRGAGNPLFAIGYDLDGEPFANPPSIGCDEIIDTNLTGPLSVTLSRDYETIVNHNAFLIGSLVGRPSELDWSFGDGTTTTNFGATASHSWTNPGTYTVTLTAYNVDHPAGVSASVLLTIDPFLSPSIQVDGVVSNAFQFSFPAQGTALYSVQYATNLAAPVAWQTLPQYYFSTTGTVMTVQDPMGTNGIRFYRVQGQ